MYAARGGQGAADGGWRLGRLPQRGFQCRTPAARHAQPRVVGQYGDGVAVAVVLDAAHAVEIDDRRAVQAKECARVELLLEALDDARSGARMAAELASETLAIQRDCMAPSSQSEGQSGASVSLNETVRVAARLAGRLTPLELHLETDDGLEVVASRSALKTLAKS